MAKEEKTLLLQDICARLPYGVRVKLNGRRETSNKFTIDWLYTYSRHIEDIKLYLRPMSSMTMDEINEYENFITNEKDDQIRFCNELIFYNSHHFDYRGLIEKGLAIEAPEGMYGENC